MKITFLEPPLALSPSDIVPRHPPQYALYAAALLQRHGYDVAVVDAFHEDLTVAQAAARTAATEPDLVLIVPWDYTRETMPEVTRVLARRLARLLPGVPLGLAGSVDLEHFREQMARTPALDFALVGEYEEVLLRLVRRPEILAQGADAPDPGPGLLLRRGRRRHRGDEAMPAGGLDGIVDTGVAPPVEDISALPYPAWDLVDFERYIFVPHRFKQSPMYPILASRGCPFACLCCKEAKYAKITRFRLRPVEDVMGEIRFAVDRWGAREIQFSDATFGLKQEWVFELCEALERSGLGLTWSALSRVDVMTPELLRAMGRAGCWNVLYGLESANQHALDNVRKRIRTEMAPQILRATQAAGIEATASFILGLPGEDRDDILRTIRWAAALRPDYAQFFILKHFGEAGELDRWGQVEEQWDLGRFDFRGPVFVPHGIGGVAELKELQKLAYRTFYLRPEYIARRLPRLLSPSQVWRNLLGLYTLGRAALRG